MVSNESFSHQYAILLRNYNIAFSQAAIIVNGFDKLLLNTTADRYSPPEFLLLKNLSRT